MPRDAQELEALVPVMRKLGVVEYDGIRLAPVADKPAARPMPRTAAELRAYMQEQAEQRRREQHDVMFLASSVKPRLDDPPMPPARQVPRAVRTREAARGSRPAK